MNAHVKGLAAGDGAEIYAIVPDLQPVKVDDDYLLALLACCRQNQGEAEENARYSGEVAHAGGKIQPNSKFPNGSKPRTMNSIRHA